MVIIIFGIASSNNVTLLMQLVTKLLFSIYLGLLTVFE